MVAALKIVRRTCVLMSITLTSIMSIAIHWSWHPACVHRPKFAKDIQPVRFQLHDESKSIFSKIIRSPGDDGSKAYRIPGLATTNAGTLVAVFDIRYGGSKDLPADIDVGMMRSVDFGETWSPMKRILDFDKNVADSKGNGVGDPAILVDKLTNTIFVAALWSHGDRAWNGSGPGIEPSETGQWVLTKSIDDGVTWSPPINISSKIQGRDSRWRLLFNGPGSGIQLRDGSLVFAAQFREAGGTPHSCFVFSRDHGENWFISPPAIPTQPPTSESQIAELDNGSLLLSMRDESKSGTRAWACWTWDGTLEREGRWSQPWHGVPDPTCMASLIQYPNGPLLFSNPNSPTKRVAMTVRASLDQGRTWTEGKLLDPRGCMYSSMSILKDGRIGILYEVADTLTFARFPLDWVLNAESPGK
jgi:sialidase-1